MTVREVRTGFIAYYTDRTWCRHESRSCCAEGHVTVAEAARHGAERQEVSAVREWTNAGAGTYAASAEFDRRRIGVA